ncbi:hypothetical protein DSCA_43400 [Desulfosarcina alkanivorans]|uniref:DUF4412 domain-containing protein n=1 Tax=Desulfosarcina alkanivorans TaxID=571177 RepID=A0A5K7YPX0_9BACT|nr:DUF4412 domain-containing protein [Desulfosarcina alkanivorans]BBO70410.1 hypothetical protein DSCA_43400 [Desulfosarcina alkanivorans]
MKRQQPIITAVYAAIILSLAVPSGAVEKFPYPTVEFSADLTMTIQQAGGDQPHVLRGKIYSIRGKERRDIASFGRRTAIINDRENDRMWTLMPDQKMYMRNPDSGAGKDPERMIRDGELKMTEMGTETVNGRKATKYKLESTGNGSDAFSGYAWLNEQNIPLRFEGTASGSGMRQDIKIEYTNIVVARQDPQLFVVPSDYRPMNAGMGASGQSVTPEKIKELMKKLKQQEAQ